MTVCSMEFALYGENAKRQVTKEFVTLEKGDNHDWQDGAFQSRGLGALILTTRHETGEKDWYECNANDPRWVLPLARITASSHWVLIKITRNGEEVT